MLPRNKVEGENSEKVKIRDIDYVSQEKRNIEIE